MKDTLKLYKDIKRNGSTQIAYICNGFRCVSDNHVCRNLNFSVPCYHTLDGYFAKHKDCLDECLFVEVEPDRWMEVMEK